MPEPAADIPDLPDDVDALKALAASLLEQVRERDAQIVERDAAPAFKRWRIPVPESARERVRQALAPKEIDARKATDNAAANERR
jgi:hypothetical protein